MRETRRDGGIALLVVLFFALLLAGSTATFLRRATVDASIAHNRDAAARAEAIARGGVRLAEALLAEDRRLEEEAGLRSDSLQDVWARIGQTEIPVAPDATLRLQIEDAYARLDLNALFADGAPLPETEVFLEELFRKVVEEMPGRPAEKLYDPLDLAHNLIDWIDEDDVQTSGGAEDEPYQRRRPPDRAPNRPLLSVDELRLVEGFDGRLVEALRPYVGVFPLALGGAGATQDGKPQGGGLNPNTAPPWVLTLLYYGSGSERRLANEDDVRDLLEARDQNLICDEGGSDLQGGGAACMKLYDAINRMDVGEPPFPPPAYQSDVFRVVAQARVRDVERSLEVVLDRSKPSEPVRLSWRFQ